MCEVIELVDALVYKDFIKTKLKIFNTYSQIYKDLRNAGSAHLKLLFWIAAAFSIKFR